jgi:hypothetical protein
MAQIRTPQILEVSRDYLKPEAVAANRKLERRAEGLCRTLGFTHPYLTISDHRVCLRTRGDVVPQWVRLGSHSGEAQAGVSAEYEITGGPDDITRQKVPLKRLESTDEFVNDRPDLSRGDPWIIGRGQFFVIVLFDGDPPMNSTVFEMKDGSRVLVRTTQTSSEARDLAASAGSNARVFRSFFYFRPQGM